MIAQTTTSLLHPTTPDAVLAQGLPTTYSTRTTAPSFATVQQILDCRYTIFPVCHNKRQRNYSKVSLCFIDSRLRYENRLSAIFGCATELIIAPGHFMGSENYKLSATNCAIVVKTDFIISSGNFLIGIPIRSGESKSV